MKGMIKIDEFIVEETGIKVVILGDKATRGAEIAMAILSRLKTIDDAVLNS